MQRGRVEQQHVGHRGEAAAAGQVQPPQLLVHLNQQLPRILQVQGQGRPRPLCCGGMPSCGGKMSSIMSQQTQ